MPPHTYHPELKVNSFYSGLSPITQMLVDNACGGTIADKRAVEALDILEKIAQNSQQRTSHVRRGGRLDVGQETQVQIQMSRMSKELQSIRELISGKPGSSKGVSQVMGEEEEGEQPFRDEEQAQALGEYQRPRNDPYSNTYNPGLRNHPNLSWSNNNHLGATNYQSGNTYQGGNQN